MKNFNFGANLRMVRLYQGINQEEMAKDLGISQAKYSRMESSSELQDLETINKLAKILKVKPKSLVSVGWYAEAVSGDNDKIKKSVAVINRRGQIAYIILIALAVWDFTFGFAKGSGHESTIALLGTGAAFALAAFFFHYFSVKHIEIIIENGQIFSKELEKENTIIASLNQNN